MEQIDNRTLQLASLPDVILRINEVLDDERKNMHDVAQVVQHDVSLTARILQIANSPALRVSGSINSVYDAILRLGVTLVKNLALCVSFKDRMNTKNVVHIDLLEYELKMSFKRSAHASVLSKMLDMPFSDVMLMAGLVGHIGHLVTLRFISESPTFRDTPKADVKLVMEDIGPVITDVILRNWDFPAKVRNAVNSGEDANIDEPSTGHDIYMLTDRYLTAQLPDVLHKRTYDFLQLHSEELRVAEELFA
jgi:HD-like signal output (HDOD) protein